MSKANVISDTTKKTDKVKEGEVEVVDPIGDTEEIEEAVFISKVINKEAIAADTNGKHFKQEMKTNLLSVAIKNTAKVTVYKWRTSHH